MQAITPGPYASQQLASRSALIRWSHAARFRLAVALAGTHPTGRLLDYGCGDGTFLGLVSGRFASCVGADVAPDQLEDCRRRLATVSNVTFCHVSELARAEHRQAYRVVMCMETLEHCLDSVADRVLDDLSRLCAPGGEIVISVPIETGPMFLVKSVVRKAAAWRGLGQYAHYETYSMGDAIRMLCATPRTTVRRPVYGEADAPYHSHYGFNWRRLRARVGRVCRIERTLFTPLPWSGGWLSSQVWFVCRPGREGGGMERM